MSRDNVARGHCSCALPDREVARSKDSTCATDPGACVVRERRVFRFVFAGRARLIEANAPGERPAPLTAVGESVSPVAAVIARPEECVTSYRPLEDLWNVASDGIDVGVCFGGLRGDLISGGNRALRVVAVVPLLMFCKVKKS